MIRYAARVNFDVSCPMDFLIYPGDVQVSIYQVPAPTWKISISRKVTVSSKLRYIFYCVDYISLE